MPLFSSLFALLAASHFLNDIVETEYSTIMRIVFIVLTLVVGFSKKPMLSYLVVFVWAISLIIRGTISHG
jgi:hypothetical protein